MPEHVKRREVYILNNAANGRDRPDLAQPGVQQVAYTVRDVDAACEALRERGVRILYEQQKSGTAGSRINFVHPKDAGGVLVELVEPARH